MAQQGMRNQRTTEIAAPHCQSFAWFAMWAIVLFVVPLPLVLTLNAGLVDSLSRVLLADLGAIAYGWWLAGIVLATRPRCLDRLVGLPSLYFLHGAIGVLSLLMAGAHALWSFSFHPQVRVVGQIAWYLLLAVVILAVLFLTGWVVDRSRTAFRAKRAISRVLPHRAMIWLHRLVFVVVALIVAHVTMIPQVSRNAPFMAVFLTMTLLAVGLYAWHLLVAPSLAARQAQVVRSSRLNSHTQQIVLRLGSHDPRPRAGDFYFVSFPGLRARGIPGEPHPFSVTRIENPEAVGNDAGRPATDASFVDVSFTIASEGDFTSRIGRIPVGAQASLEGPFGRFDPIISGNPGRPLVLIGMGAGIAPMVGLAQGHPERRITVIDVVSRAEDLYYQKDFEQIVRGRGAFGGPRLTFVSHEHRLDAQWIQAHIPHEERTEALFVVVGPAAGVLSVSRSLRRSGVARGRIVDERLTMRAAVLSIFLVFLLRSFELLGIWDLLLL